MSKGKIVAAVIGAVVIAGAVLSGYAAAGGFEKTASSVQVANDPVVRAGYQPNAHGQALVSGGFNLPLGAYRMKGFRSFSHPSTGTFCLRLPKGVPAASYVPVVSIDYHTSPSTNVSAQWVSNSADCSGTGWVEVRTFSSGTTTADEGFSIIVP